MTHTYSPALIQLRNEISINPETLSSYEACGIQATLDPKLSGIINSAFLMH